MASSLCRRAVQPVARRASSVSVSAVRTPTTTATIKPIPRWFGSASRQALSGVYTRRGGGHVDGCAMLRGEQRRCVGTIRGSAPRLEEFVMELPGLGDSITEGTVVEWRKSVGDEVAEDEIIAVVETDKVSVDVRSAHVGVVVKLFAAVDDVVEVGKPLCTIDGDEAATVRAKLEAKEAEEDASAPPPEIKKPDLEDAAAGAFMAGADFVAPKKKKHEPLIKFLGKRSREKAAQPAELAAPARHRHTPGALDFSQIVGGAAFGRPALTEEEMEAIESGGAECAPALRYIDGSRWA